MLDRDITLLQIGAHDGQYQDPVHQIIEKHHARTIGHLLEPMPHYFKTLQETYAHYPKIHLHELAIGPSNGHVQMYHVPPEDIEKHQLPQWAQGLSSLYKDRNALNFPNIEEHVTEITVRSQTLKHFLSSINPDYIDIIVTDTEGHDYQIIKNLDFSQFSPLLIMIEYINLPAQEQLQAINLLKTHGYQTSINGYNLCAVRNDI